MVAQLSERGAVYPCPTRREGAAVPSRPEPAGAARPSRRCVGTARRGWLWGCRRCLRFPAFPWVFFPFFPPLEKLSQRVRRRFWPVRPVAFSLCGVLFCEFGEQAPAAVPAGEQSSLSWKSASQRKKMQIWVVWFFFFFLSFFLKKKREKRIITF